MRHVKLPALLLSLVFAYMQLCLPVAAANSTKTAFKTAQIGGKAANMVFIKTGAGVTGEITLGLNSVAKDQAAQAHINSKNAEKGKRVLAAVNGGYFNSYYKASRTLSFPVNCAQTYATIIQNGSVVNGGGNKPAIGFTSTGKALIDRVKIETSVTLRNSTKVVIWAVNNYFKDPSSIVLLTHQMGYKVSVQASSKVVYLKNNMVTGIHSGGAISVPANTYALVYNKAAYNSAVKYGLQPQIGNSAVIDSKCTPSVAANKKLWEDVQNAIGAGPLLLLNGRDVTNTNSDFTDPKQSVKLVSVRSFAAVMSDGRLVLGTATASMKQIASYLLSIGAKDAIALDGGASSMLYTAEKGFVRTAGRKLSNVLHIVQYSSGKLPAAAKTDIQTPSDWARDSIALAESEGLVPAGLKSVYRTNITRQEFCNLAMLLIRKKSITPYSKLIAATGIKYNEVKFSDAFHIDAIDCYRLGIIGSMGKNADGTMLFCPNNSITNEQADKMLVKISEILGVKAAGGDTASDGRPDEDLKSYYTREQAISDILRIYKSQ